LEKHQPFPERAGDAAMTIFSVADGVGFTEREGEVMMNEGWGNVR